MRKIFRTFTPFWIFLFLFTFGATLHFALLSPLGENLLPIWVVGLLIGGGAFVQMILDVPAGRLLDRFGYLRLLKCGAFIFALSGLALVFDFTIVAYIASLIAATMGWLIFGPGINAYILSLAPQKDAGKFISCRDVFGSVGTVLSSATLGFVLMLDVSSIGFLIAAVMLLSLVFLHFSPLDRNSVHVQQKLPTQHHYVRRQSLRRIIATIRKLNPASTMLLLLGFSSSVFYGAVWFIVPLVIASHSDGKLLGIGLGIFDFAVVSLGYLLGVMADKGNKRTLVFFGLLIFAVSGVIIGFHFDFLFLLFGFLATTGDEMASLSLWSWLHHLDEEHAHDGVVAGVIYLFEDLGWMIAPIFAGVLYGLVGPQWTIAISSVFILLTWVAYQFLVSFHHVKRPHVSVPKKPHRFRSPS